ncbi:DUF4381 domain-containing protein [Paraglaciecola polaris]|uniref:DUF4381 domain-containing protein n=1 Tax=Paraglaciecola polaris LMG 21857 TaxID=1129793 RepID=K7A7H7_9ALTE|nr:DUF4381 domain-containing protein [Paraglaciecola polaris]GAC31410.1 hypothetical protein GPLA_0493 [Paraglaciecola polaris LMG 21857]|tara:strand:+ start:2999 stop:3502 length:504 start_codon:yes stop_codon:yes gene_type:complete
MNPLDQLKDIYIPPEVDAWPPAYGWWLIAILTTLAIIIFALFFYRRYKYNFARREALNSLVSIHAQQPDWPMHSNILLKRVCLHYFPSANIANLHGQLWCEFLVNQLPKARRNRFTEAYSELQTLLYRSTVSDDANFDTIHQQITLWLKHASFTAKSNGKQLGEKHV